nr:hypothetical protein GCM10017547_09700 [Pseudarthrobacter oxydans]
MKIMRLGDKGKEQPAVMVPSGRYCSLLPLTPDVDGEFLASGGVDKVRHALEAGSLPELEGAEALRVGPPIARPGSVVGIGMNYAAHAAESGSAPRKFRWCSSNRAILLRDRSMPLPFRRTPAGTTGKWSWESSSAGRPPT